MTDGSVGMDFSHLNFSSFEERMQLVMNLPLTGVLCDRIGKIRNDSVVFQARHSNEDVERIKREIMANSYRFRPMYRSYIPKSGGRFRPITQPASLDRLVLQGLLRVLTEFVDSSFHPLSHGFRPGRGCHSLFVELSSWGDLKMVQRSDVVSCFDRIPHDPLLTCLKLWLGEENGGTIDLLGTFLRTPILEKTGQNVATKGIGIPQGSPISPILMNIYLHTLDVRMGELVSKDELYYLRYADDIILGFPNGSNVGRVNYYFLEALHGLELEVKTEKTTWHANRSSSGLRLLGLICRIGANGRIRARPPFPKWKKRAFSRYMKPPESGVDPRDLEVFFMEWWFVVKNYLPYVFGCPCAREDKELISYFRSSLKHDGLEWIRRNAPRNKEEYDDLCARYSRDLVLLVNKRGERRCWAYKPPRLTLKGG